MRYALGIYGLVLAVVTGSLIVTRQEPSSVRWIVFKGDGYLYRMSEQGTIIRRISDSEINEFALSPDRTSIAYIYQEDSRFNIRHTDIAGTIDKQIAQEVRPRSPLWSPDGNRLAYVSYDKAIPYLFSVDMQALLRNRLLEKRVTFTKPDWSANRIALYSPGSQGQELLVLDIQKEETQPIAVVQGNPVVPPVFSPDGDWVLFAANYAFQNNGLDIPIVSGENDLHAIHYDGQALRQITVGLSVNDAVFWTEDWIVFSAREDNAPRTHKSILVVKSDGTQLTKLTEGELNANVTDVSDSGQWILARRAPFPANIVKLNSSA